MAEEVDLREGNISLILDGYNDLFSDFDPRHFSERALSDDFLAESKRASRDKPAGSIEVKFLVPEKKRNYKDEVTIKRRLKEHFRKHFLLIDSERKRIIKQGFLFILFGLVLMAFATYVLFYFEGSLITHFIVVISEPGGWFLFWEGLDLIIFESKKLRPERDYFEKMSKAVVYFNSY